LIAAWTPSVELEAPERTSSAWVDGGFRTEPDTLRESSPGLTVLLAEDVERVRSGQVRVQEVALPMNPPPKVWRDWRSWPQPFHLPVAPREAITYDAVRGARWRSE
jgi:hypothetical protein